MTRGWSWIAGLVSDGLLLASSGFEGAASVMVVVMIMITVLVVVLDSRRGVMDIQVDQGPRRRAVAPSLERYSIKTVSSACACACACGVVPAALRQCARVDQGSRPR
jgi:hypothetical protein